MKVQAVDNFISKLSLINSGSFRQELAKIVNDIESSSDIEFFLSKCQKNKNVYSFQIQPYTLYFSLIEGDLYFIDIIEPINVFKGSSSRNPKYNSSINPKFNSSINPKFNSSINPKFNSSINPKFNSSINPKFNSNINGLYIYDVKTDSCLYYCVKLTSNDKILMIYDYQQIKVAFYGVKRASGYCIFDFEQSSYVGFLESNGKDGYNWFDLNINWLRYAV